MQTEQERYMEQALALARDFGAAIQYDETAQAPFFRYFAADGIKFDSDQLRFVY